MMRFKAQINNGLSGVWLVAGIALLLIGQQPVIALDPAFVIRLLDTSLGYGELTSSSHNQQLSFQVQGFEQALQFSPDQVHSIRRQHRPAEIQQKPRSPELLLFALRGRQQVIGKIVSMDESQLVVATEELGPMTLSRADLLRISPAPSVGKTIKNVFDATDWVDPNNLNLWDFSSIKMSTSQAGARILANFELPQQAELKLALQWTGKPSFSVGLGVDPKQSLNADNNVRFGFAEGAKPPPVVGRLRSFASLEVWDSSLVLVRESAQQSKFVQISNLDNQSECELTVYLDQSKGFVAVQSHDGKLYQLNVESKVLAKAPMAALLQNFGGNLTIGRLTLSTWDGQLPLEFTSNRSVVIKSDDSAIDGAIEGWDEQTESWIVRTSSDLVKIPRVELKLASFSPADTTPDDPEAPSVPVVDLILIDGSRLTGQLLASAPDTIGFQTIGSSEPRVIGIDLIDEILCAKKHPAAVAGNNKGLVAKVGLSRIQGQFVENTPKDSTSPIYWQPTSGLNAVALDYRFSGEIHRDTPPKPTNLPAVADPTQPIPRIAPQRLNIFQQIFGGAVPRPIQANSAVKAENRRVTATGDSNQSQIRFRSGDVAPAAIHKVTEAGVRFESSRTTTTFAPNTAIDQIFFRSAIGKTLSDDERKRLLTIPRAQKNDPPTHLVISVAGDYLRGHLIEANPQSTIVEVRGEVMEFPTGELSEIVWLYDRNWTIGDRADSPVNPDTAAPMEESSLAVHIVTGNDQGLTLLPQRVSAGELTGNSELLGEITLKLDEVTQLFFGPDTSRNARLRRSQTYELSLAQLPIESSSNQSGGDSQLVRHELVGKPAPDFSLLSLADKPVRLAEQRGRIIVLDFWASWCGPCMQAMPQLEQLIQEFPDQDVRLIAVNIQEAKPRIELALQRLKVACEVALDVEGEVAAAYRASAIPQTVIIDKAGDVVDVVVGGGQNSLDQIRKSIEGLLSRGNQSAQ